MDHKIQLTEFFPVTPATLYQAWLDSDLHTEMTGGEATCSNEPQGTFTAWDGYISGQNKELLANEKIVQTWRTTEFKPTDPDSEIQLDFKSANGGCALTLTHINIPADQPDYAQGWIDHYFEPMRAYFEK